MTTVYLKKIIHAFHLEYYSICFPEYSSEEKNDTDM